jgi:hypothetical protein
MKNISPKLFLWIGLIIACLITLDTQAGQKSGIIVQVTGSPAGVSESSVRIVSVDKGHLDMTITVPTDVSVQIALKPGTYELVGNSVDGSSPLSTPVVVEVGKKEFNQVVLSY